MPKKKQSGTSKLGAPVSGHSLSMKWGSGSEKELADAIEASLACSLQDKPYKESLCRALELSCATASSEAEEAEALKLAIEASLMDAKQKAAGLSLRTELESGLCESRMSILPAVTENSLRPLEDHEIFLGEAALEKTALGGTHCAENSSAQEPTSGCSSHVLKVAFGNDMRRLRTSFASIAAPGEIMFQIKTSIEDGFGWARHSQGTPPYLLKYVDDEGDHCTLVEETLGDFLDIMACRGNFLRIVLEECPPSSTPQSIQDFSIGTPPMTPRSFTCETDDRRSVEDDYDAMWSIVDAGVA